MLDDYRERLDYLYRRLNYEWVGMPRIPTELRLRRMRRLMRKLGDPHVGLRVIHVAGTKGKGSTAALMAASLTAAGHRTGLYSSPHLHRLEERYSIDGVPATPDELVGLVDEVRAAAEQLEAEDRELRQRAHDVLRDHHGDGPASFRPPPGRRGLARRLAWEGGSIQPTWFILCSA